MSEQTALTIRSTVAASGGSVLFEIYSGKGVGDDTLICQMALTSAQAQLVAAGINSAAIGSAATANTVTTTRLAQNPSLGGGYSNTI